MPALIQFFMRLQKGQQRDNKQKFNKNLRENNAEAVNAYFAAQHMFHLAFLNCQLCGIRALFNEIK